MAIPIGSRMVKRPITKRTIRALATPESFARGRSYFDDSAVSDLVRRGDRLTAEVEGSELAPYQVSIRLRDGGVTEARCSCPYDLGGYCKHIVAVLLKFADEGTRVIERKPLAKLLRELDQSRLIELLEKRAESDSELAAWIEAELATTVEPSSLRNKEVGRRRTPVDPEPVREHTRNLPVELLLNAVKGFIADLAPHTQPVQCRALGSDRVEPQFVVFGRSLRLMLIFGNLAGGRELLAHRRCGFIQLFLTLCAMTALGVIGLYAFW